MSYYDQLQEAVAAISPELPEKPGVALTLGSGLGFIAEELTDTKVFPYREIPHFPVSTVPGHDGSLVYGKWEGVPVLLMRGRVHLYEGHSAREVARGTRVAVLLGARTVVLTNAAGGLNPSWNEGDFMVIRDHLNLQGVNLLTGAEEPRLGERFVDLTNLYDPTIGDTLLEWAGQQDLNLREGVYAGLSGPSYETPAEVRMLRTLGADAVGMSTVQEAIAAHQMNARVVGISAVTNLAAGVSSVPLSHDDVQVIATRSRGSFAALLRKLVSILD